MWLFYRAVVGEEEGCAGLGSTFADAVSGGSSGGPDWMALIWWCSDVVLGHSCDTWGSPWRCPGPLEALQRLWTPGCTEG